MINEHTITSMGKTSIESSSKWNYFLIYIKICISICLINNKYKVPSLQLRYLHTSAVSNEDPSFQMQNYFLA